VGRVGWVAAVAALAVTLAAGLACGRAVDRVEDAETAAAQARGAADDLRAMVRARFDEAAGRAGFDGGMTTRDDDLRYVLDELVADAGGDGDAGALADEVLDRDEELREDADDGVPDERLVAGMDITVRELERLALDGTSGEADDAATGARRTVTAALVVSSLAWAAAAWTLARRRADRPG
jgi:hypothetical protein